MSSYASCAILCTTKNERKQNSGWVQKSVAQCTSRFNHLSPSTTTGFSYPPTAPHRLRLPNNYQIRHIKIRLLQRNRIDRMPLYELFCIASHNPTSPVCPSFTFPFFYFLHSHSQNGTDIQGKSSSISLIGIISNPQ